MFLKILCCPGSNQPIPITDIRTQTEIGPHHCQTHDSWNRRYVKHLIGPDPSSLSPRVHAQHAKLPFSVSPIVNVYKCVSSALQQSVSSPWAWTRFVLPGPGVTDSFRVVSLSDMFTSLRGPSPSHVSSL